jgi:hypothetical protein
MTPARAIAKPVGATTNDPWFAGRSANLVGSTTTEEAHRAE